MRLLGHVLWSVARTVVAIGIVEDLLDASADGWSTWDWVLAGLAVILTIDVVRSIVALVTGRRVATEPRAVDLARVRATHERDGHVAAVHEVRRQDPALSLVEASRMVDAL